MSKRQTRKMLRLMASGEPVELTSAMASVKKLAKLAFVAQQFGYEYADVRQGGGNNSQLRMLIVPDHSPQARTRAAQNRAQYPNAHDGVSLPPLVPDALELLKARINFDLTGKSAEKRMGYGALGVSLGCVVVAFRMGGASSDFVIAAVIWLALMAVFGIGLLVTRKRNAKFAARLQAAGFAPVADGTGRVRYLPPGGQMPGQHGSPFGGGPYGAQAPGMPAPAPVPGYGHQPPQPPMPYGQPAPYGTPPQAPASAPHPYAQPQPPYGQPAQQQTPYGQPPQR
ncbi:membrane protein [Streptomyces caelestis]|uniref:Membrane protein n=1 Tax=Streptomyces caelestis TaxID=36816 RepID=A0A0M8QPU7_9ACTN|nr:MULTISPECIES: membrane protein [Streptomyces]KOT36147.1 membrane protein [Streptomyces caelestis]